MHFVFYFLGGGVGRVGDGAGGGGGWGVSVVGLMKRDFKSFKSLPTLGFNLVYFPSLSLPHYLNKCFSMTCTGSTIFTF